MKVDVVELLKYVNGEKKSNERSVRSSRTRRDKKKSALEVLIEMQLAAEEWKKVLENFEKMIKKEEKKDDKKKSVFGGIDTAQLATLYMLSAPIIGAMTYFILKKMGV